MEIAKFKKALVEVEAILNELSMQEYNKIPDDIIDYIDANKDENYSWDYDYDKSLENQSLSEYTLEILAYINNEFLLNDEQKKVMEEIFELNDKKEKQNTTTAPIITFKDANNIFEYSKDETEKQKENTETSDNNRLHTVISNKKNLFLNIVNVIKNFFHEKSK